MPKYEKYFIPVYKRLKINVTGGEGCFLTAAEGKYLDMFSGLGVNVLGYGNKKVADAIREQTVKFTHLSNYFEAEPAGRLAKYLAENTFAEKVFFANSGTEAVEAGLKIIRKYGSANNKPDIITFTKAFHGRTLGSSSVTAPDQSSSYNKGISDIKILEFNNIADLKKIGTKTAGVFIEAVQGQGGVNVADTEFLKHLRNRTEEAGAILMADEIQSGMGRTGKLFSFEHYGIVPDLAVIAKAIGGGLPLGVLLAGNRFCDYLTFGEHGSTFGGNPVSCAAGLASVRQINKPAFLESVIKKGGSLNDRLNGLKQKYPEKIGRISGLGLMIGVEILKGHGSMADLFLDRHILVNMTQGNVLRLLPPLIISDREIQTFISVFEEILKLK
jgi:acetylornithine/N-succinyldiaminopimelate aminotransferase